MVYYKLYVGIANELQEATGVFTLKASGELCGLNLCMAPGGYTRVLLDNNPGMAISGITLPVAQSGHPVMAEAKKGGQVEVKYLDMNLLASSMVLEDDIPKDHPDAENFLFEDPFPGDKFDIVIADGAVLRTHERGEHRLDKEREALRLRLSQLVFGFERIKKGGTFMILLHRIDSWENFMLLHNLEEFSEIQVHKPRERHGESSSFYLVAKNVEPDNPTVATMLKEWKASWRQATFGGKEGTGELPEGPDNDAIATAFRKFGERLMKLGSPIWHTQAEVSHARSFPSARLRIKSFCVHQMLSHSIPGYMKQLRDPRVGNTALHGD